MGDDLPRIDFMCHCCMHDFRCPSIYCFCRRWLLLTWQDRASVPTELIQEALYDGFGEALECFQASEVSIPLSNDRGCSMKRTHIIVLLNEKVVSKDTVNIPKHEITCRRIVQLTGGSLDYAVEPAWLLCCADIKDSCQRNLLKDWLSKWFCGVFQTSQNILVLLYRDIGLVQETSRT
jgi:hypothetical protein